MLKRHVLKKRNKRRMRERKNLADGHLVRTHPHYAVHFVSALWPEYRVRCRRGQERQGDARLLARLLRDDLLYKLNAFHRTLYF